MYFASGTCYFLEQQFKNLYKVYYAYKCINIYFICKNDAPLAADGATNTQSQHGSSCWLHLNCCSPPCLCPNTRNVSLILPLCTSEIPALSSNLKSVYFFKLVASLWWLLRFNSSRGILILFPFFPNWSFSGFRKTYKFPRK